MMVTVDLTKTGGRRCAFCKNCFDPTCSAIEEVRPNIGFWHYDNTAIKGCGMYGMEHKGFGSCKKFECKV